MTHTERHQRLRIGACRLCMALDHESTSEFTEGIVRLSDAFPVVPGHELLVTTGHTVGLGHAWSSHSLTRLASTISRHFAMPHLLLEHGVTATRPRRGCIDHAHMHVIPDTDADVGRLLATRAFSFLTESQLDLVALPELPSAVNGRDYLWFSNSEGYSILIQPPATITVPAQLARRAIAETLRISNWDWRRQLALSTAAKSPRGPMIDDPAG